MRSLVIHYVGPSHAGKVRRARWRAGNCEPIAAAARALADLKSNAQDLAQAVTASALPKSTPPLVHEAASMMLRRTAAATDTLGATIRALQLMGISYCTPRNLPLTECPCLLMVTRETAGEVVKERVDSLIADVTHDLKEL